MDREVSHYVVTAHPAGGALHSVKCNFLAPDSEVKHGRVCYHFVLYVIDDISLNNINL